MGMDICWRFGRDMNGKRCWRTLQVEAQAVALKAYGGIASAWSYTVNEVGSLADMRGQPVSALEDWNSTKSLLAPICPN